MWEEATPADYERSTSALTVIESGETTWYVSSIEYYIVLDPISRHGTRRSIRINDEDETQVIEFDVTSRDLLDLATMFLLAGKYRLNEQDTNNAEPAPGPVVIGPPRDEIVLTDDNVAQVIAWLGDHRRAGIARGGDEGGSRGATIVIPPTSADRDPLVIHVGDLLFWTGTNVAVHTRKDHVEPGPVHDDGDEEEAWLRTELADG